MPPKKSAEKRAREKALEAAKKAAESAKVAASSAESDWVDVPTCPECQSAIDDKENCITCDLCQVDLHISCMGWPQPQYYKWSYYKKEMQKLSPVRVFCPSCQKIPMSSLRHAKDLNSPKPKRLALGDDKSEQILSSIQALTSRVDDFVKDRDEMKSQLDAVSSFLAPAKQRSFASVASVSRQVAKPSCLTETISSSLAKQSEESLIRRSLIIAGLPAEEGEDLRAKTDEIWKALDISDWIKTISATRLPKSQESDAPALIKVDLMDDGMVKLACSVGKSLLKTANYSRVFLRPARTSAERSLIRSRLQRLSQLNSENMDENTRYFIAYRKDGFPIVRVSSGVVNWAWIDPGPILVQDGDVHEI